MAIIISGYHLLSFKKNIWNIQEKYRNILFQWYLKKCYFGFVDTITFLIYDKIVPKKWNWVEEEVRSSEMQQGKRLYVPTERPVDRASWTMSHISSNNINRFEKFQYIFQKDFYNVFQKLRFFIQSYYT